MKQLSHLLTALVFCSLMIFISCKSGGGGEETDPADAVGTKLVSTWNFSSAKLNGTEDRDEWDGLSIVLTYDEATNSGDYTVSGRPDISGAELVWPNSGSFTLEVNGSVATATRSDGTSIAVTVGDSGLDLKFTIEEGGRVATFDGSWQFVFVK